MEANSQSVISTPTPLLKRLEAQAQQLKPKATYGDDRVNELYT